MAEFGVYVKTIEIEPHPNADLLELAKVGDYRCVVGKDLYKSGDLVAYIPEASLVGEDTIKFLELEGRLAGADKNRVKAIKLRGVVSQGVCYPAKDEWKEGDEVAELLGIEKYEPPIPATMAGEVYNAGLNNTVNYDVENYKGHSDILQDGEEVVFTEKIHGTFVQFLCIPESQANGNRFAIASKGLGARGLCFKLDSEKNDGNVYVRVARHLGLEEKFLKLFGNKEVPTIVCGEVFGKGVQDLDYGSSTAQDDTLGIRIFDIYEGFRSQGKFLDEDDLNKVCELLGLERVPILYRGPFSKEKMIEYMNGRETISGKESHIREGIVMRPVVGRRDNEIGRVQLKAVSDKYLTRKNGTEHN